MWDWSLTELEQEEALRYLRGWLQHHPKYGSLVPQEVMNRLNHSEVGNVNLRLSYKLVWPLVCRMQNPLIGREYF